MTATDRLAIGQVAAATGVAVSALRHYEQLGVIAPIERVGGKRRFATDTVGRVNFVRKAQRFGFSLTEIRDILDDRKGQATQIAVDKITELRSRQEELATMIGLLEEMQACGCQVVAECPSMATRC